MRPSLLLTTIAGATAVVVVGAVSATARPTAMTARPTAVAATSSPIG